MMYVIDPPVVGQMVDKLDAKIRELRSELVRLQQAKSAFEALQTPYNSPTSPVAEPAPANESPAEPLRKRGRPRKADRRPAKPLRDHHPDGKIVRRKTIQVCQILADLEATTMDELVAAVGAREGYKRIPRKYRRSVSSLVYRRTDLFQRSAESKLWKLTETGRSLVQAAQASQVV